MKNNVLIPVYDINKHDAGNLAIDGFAVGRSLNMPAHNNEPHRHTGFTITLLLSGQLTQYIDFEKHTVSAPAVILLAPDQVHQHGEEDTISESVYIHFDKDFLLAESQGMMNCWACIFYKRAIPVKAAQMQELMNFAGLILKEYANVRPLRESIIRNLLNALVMACGRLPQHNIAYMQLVDSAQNRMVRQFNELSDQHFRDKTQVSNYAELLFVTPGHLNDTIKSAVGKTAKQVIDEKRIMEAKRLLFWGEHSVKEIAWKLNFEDDAYFNRFFKKHTGQTPALFQRSIREKYN
ncbi:helix-turn-helix domain-containing protein [Chitinophaga agrisoli]|uniref:Helix-turn-helix domain-containing protein n=1 Tax=Chitinophaga agrisoli TaxID=2607653 RepID=A0A5B2VL49_9BACT|nr:helix-turn-helix domain-containing protein [Chitinophaga agrisoli]KAA2239544.1 helix-turn-helix domain-containing protein [Chitinophaga agrisoli]